MDMPKLIRYDFPPKVYVVLDEGQENDILKDSCVIVPVEVETVMETEEGPTTIVETRYKILCKVYEDTGLEFPTQDGAARRAASELLQDWERKSSG
jgi:hypothetical protein